MLFLIYEMFFGRDDLHFTYMFFRKILPNVCDAKNILVEMSVIYWKTTLMIFF